MPIENEFLCDSEMQDTIREGSIRYNQVELDGPVYLGSESDLSLDFADLVPQKRLHT